MASIIYPKTWASQEKLFAADLNAQFAAVAAIVNGQLANDNLIANANIVGTKLADAPNGVPTSKINNGAVTTEKIAPQAITGDKIAPGAVTANGALNGRIVDADIVNVSATKLLPGALPFGVTLNGTNIIVGSVGPTQLQDVGFITDKQNFLAGTSVWAQSIGGADSDVGIALVNGVEMLLAEAAWSARGGYFVGMGVANGHVVSNPMIGGPDVVFNLRLNGNPGASDGTVLQRYFCRVGILLGGVTSGFVQVPICASLLTHGLFQSGTARLKITALLNTNGIANTGCTITSPRVVVSESC